MKRLFIFLLCSAPTLFVACDRTPRFVEYDPSVRISVSQQLASQIIVVARILSNPEKIGRPRPSNWDQTFPVQLYRARVKVENILKGDTASSDTAVYYLRSLGAMVGPARLGMAGTGGTWRTEDRELFFLSDDSGVLRTICDTWNTCVVPVFSGAHPGFKPDPGKPLAEAIIDLLLTRGQDCSDQQMVQAISKSGAENFSREYAFKKLRQLATDETPAVRKAACDELSLWKQPCALPAGN